MEVYVHFSLFLLPWDFKPCSKSVSSRAGMIQQEGTTYATPPTPTKLKTGWGVLLPLSKQRGPADFAQHLSFGQAGPLDALASGGRHGKTPKQNSVAGGD